MNCSELRALEEVLPLREWTAEQLASAEGHAGACGACRALLEQARALESALQGLPEPAAPSQLTSTVMARISRLESRAASEPVSRSRRRPVERPRQPDWQLTGIAAAGVAGLGAYLFRLLEGGVAAELPSLWLGGWIQGLGAGARLDAAGIIAAVAVMLYLGWSLSPHLEPGEGEES